MKTSCGLTYAGPGRIAICRMAWGFPAGFRMYRPLAPGDWFKDWLKNSRDYSVYYRRYRKQLDKLDPEQALEDLKVLAAPHAPVLLCWESPPLHSENWCHRSIAARWFWETLGLEVKERYYGKHKSWHWKKLPPFTAGRTPRKSKAVGPSGASEATP